MKNLAAELILVDNNAQRCAGELKDLSDALGFSYVSRIVQGTFQDAKRADIIIISAGRAQKPGESRLGLLSTNKGILESIAKELQGLNPQAIVMIVSNPLDILTYHARSLFDLPGQQILGTGTFLDSQRLKYLISQAAQVSLDSVEGYVIGEHGDSQSVPWSQVRIGGLPIERFGFTTQMKEEYARTVRAQAYEIIEAKGATFFGIATCVAQLAEFILFNRRQIVPLSTYHEAYGVCFSLPVILGERGIEAVPELELTAQEQSALNKSAEALRKSLALLKA